MEFIVLLTPLKSIYPTVIAYQGVYSGIFLKLRGAKEYAVA